MTRYFIRSPWIAVVALALAPAASFGDSVTLGQTTNGTTLQGAATPAASPSPSVSPSISPTSITIQTTTGSSGATYLVDQTGKSLYVFAADSANTTTCTGSCAVVWPPLLIASGGTPTAATSSSVQQSLLGTLIRPDGTTQVTYNSLPLYNYTGDTAAGQTNGEALTSFGAIWYLIQPDGTQLTTLTSASPSPSPSASGSATTGSGTTTTSGGTTLPY
ncbi:MAG: hypothetical protein P4M08_03300 [Oligoflexia bacterium]|nr:hypothetical protein [Oligoflexia bacterium]